MTNELVEGTAEWVAKCQTYEGGMKPVLLSSYFEGISGVHFGEAHGGYTFCGYAALYLLNKTHLIDESALLVRQFNVELTQ